MLGLLLFLALFDTQRRTSHPLELVLDAGHGLRRGEELEVTCYLRNNGQHPIVAVNARFYYADRVQYSLEPMGAREISFKRRIWRCGCTGIHPFGESDFIEIPAGKMGRIGTVTVRMTEGRYWLNGKYVFEKPKGLDPRYFPNERVRQLFDRTIETNGVVSAPVLVDWP